MATVQFDQAAMRQLALGAAGISDAIDAKGDEAKAVAEGLSAEFIKTGDYERSFNVRTEVVETGRLGPRYSAIVENTSDHALAVEFGNKHFPNPHHVLGRTADAMRG